MAGPAATAISAIHDQLAEAYDNADKRQAISAQSDLAMDGEPPAHVSYGLSYPSGARHPTYKKIAGDEHPKPLLDVNALAIGESFYGWNWVASPSQEWIALVEDDRSRDI